jgi:gluconolactonase
MILDRRTFLAGTSALAAVSPVSASWEPTERLPDPAVEIVDPSFAKYRLGLAAVERVASGFRWAEGPVWFGDLRTLVFSDVSNDRLMKWDEETGAVSVLRRPSNYANGCTRDRQGRLLVCEHRSRSVTRTEHDGTLTVLLDRFEGKRLNSPNDIVCRSDGSIWFTDPAFGPNPYEAMAAPELPGNVYRLDPSTGEAVVAVSGIRGPNGLCFSPDESRLYVVEARSEPNRLIRVYDVVENGTQTANGRVFFDCGKGTADGFRADVDGNLWCGWGMGEGLDGVIVLSPEGKLIGRIHLPERCGNLCFGGRDRNRLMMAATRSIYTLYVNTRGAGIC